MSEQLYFTINAGRAKRGTPVLDSQPGAHTGASRKLIPGYSDSNIVFWNDATGNDGNTGASIAQAVETYAQAATLAGSTKKIRKVNSSTVSVSITKPTEATIGTTSTIASSLTAPVDTWTQAGTPGFTTELVYAVAWSPLKKLFVAVSDGGTIAHSPDGNVWAMAVTPSFSGTTIRGVCWAEELSVFVAVGQSGKIAYSADGITWTQVTSNFGSSFVYSVVWAKSIGLLVACGESNKIGYSSDGVTWTVVTLADNDESLLSVAWSESLGRLVAINGQSPRVYYSDNGVSWKGGTITAISSGSALCYAEALGLFVGSATFSGTPKFIYSADGITWTASTTTPASQASGIAYSAELNKLVSMHVSGVMYYSSDADTWTAVTTEGFGASNIFAAAYSPLLGKFVAVGNSAKIGYSTAFASTISAHVAGFTIQAMQYSGTVTAYNCTFIQPGTTAALSFDSCRITESGSHISNNARSSSGTLYEGDRHTTGAPASQNAISMTRDTVAGVWYIYPSSATGYEEIKDNIIEGGIVSSYAVTVTSGNTRGTSYGAVFSEECTQSDPKFVDDTDYKLQREMDSYQYDSPLVAASQFYFNANGDARDLGAWSYNESTMEMLYTRHFPFLLPTGKDSFSNVLHSRVNRHVGEDGTPDVINDIDALWEEITLRYQTLPSDHIDFLDWWQGNFSDMTCEIDFFVGQPVSSTITVNGAHSAGDVTLTIDAGTTLAAGDRIFSGTEVYSVLYMVDDTLAVLSRKLAAGIADNAFLTISQPTGKGTYQYLPQADRDLRKPMGQAASEFDRGLVLNFSRKRV